MRTGFEFDELENIKDKLSKRYPMLTKSDLIWRHGTKIDWLRIIARKIGKSSKELQNEIDLIFNDFSKNSN